MPADRKTAKFLGAAILVFALLAMAGVATVCPAPIAAAGGIDPGSEASHQVLEIPPASLPDSGWHLSQDVTTSTGAAQEDEKHAKKQPADGESDGSETSAHNHGVQPQNQDAGLSSDPSVAGINDYMSQQADDSAAIGSASAFVLYIPRPLLGLRRRNPGRLGMPPNPFFGSPNPFTPALYDPYRLHRPPWLGPSPYRAPFMPRAGYPRR